MIGQVMNYSAPIESDVRDSDGSDSDIQNLVIRCNRKICRSVEKESLPFKFVVRVSVGLVLRELAFGVGLIRTTIVVDRVGGSLYKVCHL